MGSALQKTKTVHLSPFRYPGGKSWLVPEFRKWLISLPFKPKLLIEPFLGGGIISLTAAYHGLVNKCIMIEKDEEVASVWKTILHGNWNWLIEQIKTFCLTPETAREIINSPVATCEEMAFKTILKNRVCYGGIINGAGLLKSGDSGKGILSRWNPDALAERIKTIVSMKDKLKFFEGDAFDYIPYFINREETVFFCRPSLCRFEEKTRKKTLSTFRNRPQQTGPNVKRG